jgi:NAD(P)-dependent dehydrogenase (short-subunit alcohol dehydrogenase family)
VRAREIRSTWVIFLQTPNAPETELTDKVAVVYGARGAIGGAVAAAFEAAGAKVFATGREEVDALDGEAIERHLRGVVDAEGRIDISFNAIGIPDADIVGVPLAELDAERFARPITEYATSYFLTARAAARHMIAARAGAIMTVSAFPARAATRLNGGYGPALAAKDALTRDLSMELAPHGIRVLALRPHGIPESSTMRELYELKKDGFGGISWDGFADYLDGMTHARRSSTLEEVANMAVFAASDKGSSLTGTTLNLTLGGIAD